MSGDVMPAAPGGDGRRLWPVPEVPRRVTFRRWVLKTVAVGLWILSQSPGGEWKRPPKRLSSRWADLQSGGLQSLTLQLRGSVLWARPVEPGLVELAALSAHVTAAIPPVQRAIPLRELRLRGLRRPTPAERRDGFGSRSWVLDVDDHDHPAVIGGDIRDLGLLGSVAGWTAPPNLPRTRAQAWSKS